MRKHKLHGRLQNAFTWIGFDLDDTLHRFTHASGVAQEAVFQLIIAGDARCKVDELRAAYKNISRETVAAFVDGRTSHEYRVQRMDRLLRTVGAGSISASECVNEYAHALGTALSLHADAEKTVEQLKSRGLRIAVISEGPHDAQEWTLRRLGLSDTIDMLMTSNRERISKHDGLFERFRQRVDVEPERIVIVGDSVERDIEPARRAGMHAIRFAPDASDTEKSTIPTIRRFVELIPALGNLGQLT